MSEVRVVPVAVIEALAMQADGALNLRGEAHMARTLETIAEELTALSAAPQGDGWISVGERLPEGYMAVMVWAWDALRFAYYQPHDGGTDGHKAECWYEDIPDSNDPIPVTHWQPLPSPPTQPASGDGREGP